MAGCNFYQSGSKIQAHQDPFYYNQALYFDYWGYTDSYGIPRTYLGFAWLSSTGILYDEYGNALNELEDGPAPTDIIAEAAKTERKTIQHVGQALATKYSSAGNVLSADQGVKIAKTLNFWAKIGKDRARTDADIALMSERLYGIKADRAKSALTAALAERSLKPLEELNVDVASHWATTPEVSQRILKSWYKQELERNGAL